MAGLQRSEVSFRRQGSSGLVWDDRLLTEELNQEKQEEVQGQEQQGGDQEKVDSKDIKPVRTISPSPINTVPRSRSSGEKRGYRTGKVSPAVEPPSPKLSACGFCSAFGKAPKNHRKKAGKHRSR
ncbi:hypothetical protein SLEP1_g44036 [Rubroshorea leprosula]|uniref:MAPK kinase substrate protein n=1 Tax=Rubroshorea leprosula TaxID=152421 RepID=A0AAV5LEY0_9ROSI|nr:hypothetical protein SLEP1_g44036 [Rubroshorea leprosula]